MSTTFAETSSDVTSSQCSVSAAGIFSDMLDAYTASYTHSDHCTQQLVMASKLK